ncbi:zinc ribbon domain-containing protein [Methanotrichaceae archaeon M04Ac]|uniref:Zinc ribbon domain-containing protein n=1 Tax=Candidatus Methanocrinis alkalitolerans TaxID=3033395 RepID=A0ABT5XCA8_9EURY|nr:zinc ribbon domain-containing protein [Candidatus Methanocrinis alkalitolerans]MDF0592281.1 zinc ribbon domain-containing protein [Candidatus Methanocrinis alkalitolerans]
MDPAYTSQECPVCHHISRSNRPTRDQFACVCCGFSGPADTVAARNIAARVGCQPAHRGPIFCGAASPQYWRASCPPIHWRVVDARLL